MEYAKDDMYYMGLALQLAKSCKPIPNPQVGAIIVRDNKIIGKGYHHAPGMPHAEIEALEDAQRCGNDVSDATMYVTLEPCCHHGRTGPCCEAIHNARIGRVVIGMQDPDELVAGKGIAYLTTHGHAVSVGVEETACTEMLDTYIQHRILNRPLFHLKAAITLDGFIASIKGDSKWITGPVARAKGHELRATHDAILVGIGTVIADDPLLTVRDAKGNNPARIVLDTHLRIPLNARLLNSPNEADVVILHGPRTDDNKTHALQQISGVQLVCCSENQGRLEMAAVVSELKNLGFLSVLIEGGSAVHGAFIQAQLADRFSVFVAPKLLGNGISWAGFPGVAHVSDCIQADGSAIRTTELNGDILIEGSFQYKNR